MWASVVVEVSGILFRLFSFIFYHETPARASVATLWNNWLVQTKFNAHVRPVRTKYSTRIL